MKKLTPLIIITIFLTTIIATSCGRKGNPKPLSEIDTNQTANN